MFTCACAFVFGKKKENIPFSCRLVTNIALRDIAYLYFYSGVCLLWCK